MVAFITSMIVLALMVGVVFIQARRRPVGAYLSWGEALAAGTYAFLVMFWAYGVVPHLWLTWADSELKWRPDVLAADYIPGMGFLMPQEKGGSFPMTISMQALRDIVVVVLYVALLGGQMWLFSWWQKRGSKPTTDLVTSEYGRPLVKKA